MSGSKVCSLLSTGSYVVVVDRMNSRCVLPSASEASRQELGRVHAIERHSDYHIRNERPECNLWGHFYGRTSCHSV